jgi:hypothetical protein
VKLVPSWDHWDDTLTLEIELDRADLERLRDDETTEARIVKFQRLIEQSSVGPAQLVVELDTRSWSFLELLRGALTNKTRRSQTLDGALVAGVRSRPRSP